jgi:ribosomal-protein-alanine N-acetyltransferase
MERLETPRLLLRPWAEEDADDLYEYARDPRVGPAAGWPAHKSREESAEIIRTVFSAPHVFAVAWKESGKVIGSAGYVDRHQTLLPGPDDEIGYALNPAYWGRGLMPEAVRELLRYGFEDLGLRTVWCGHDERNDKSRRVIEKCGFRYRMTERSYSELMGEERTSLLYALTRDEWAAR